MTSPRIEILSSELELNPETLRGWVKKYQKQHELS